MDTTTIAIAPTLEAPLDLVLLPITFGTRAGTMRLADGRLTYTRRRHRQVVFDAPVGEFHSFARSWMGTGFHLWRGRTRYRFVAYHPVMPAEYGPGAVAGLAESATEINRGMAQMARSRADVDRWHNALAPAIAPAPPAGVAVRRPLSSGRFLAAMLGGATAATVIFMAIIAAVVLATS